MLARSPHRTLHARGVLALLAAGSLLLAACGDSQGGGSQGEAESPGQVTDLTLVPATIPPPVELPEVRIPAELPTELQITDLTEGTGPAAAVGDMVVVDYIGVRSVDGERFDESYSRGQPFPVVLGEGSVIQGWELGLIGARTGMRRQLDIPAELAYGDSPRQGGVIQPGDALTFVVDIRAVASAQTPDQAPLDLAERGVTGGSEIVIDDVVIGEGEAAAEGDTGLVRVVLLRGDDLEVIYSSWEFGLPDPVPLSFTQTLPALVEGIIAMRAGGIRVVSVPPALGFGEDGNANIGLEAGVDLIMILELVARY